MKSRNATLDLSRFLAAFIVLAGHFLYFDANLAAVARINLLEVFHTGANAVYYFFALSGYVLSQNQKSINFNWLKARCVRLMPIYSICYTLPIIGVLALAPSELHTQSLAVLLMGITGLQAISSHYYLIGFNSPLWSLSVEIYLSILLIFLARIKRNPIFLSLAIALSLINTIISHPILGALPFFLVGIYLSKLNKGLKFAITKSRILKFTLLIILFSYWLIFPILGISFSGVKYAPLVDLFFIASTLYFFILVETPHKLRELAVQLGLRSYVIYASHVPILRIYNQVWSRIFASPVQYDITLSIIYIIGGFICVAIGTEILFRTIEKNAITWAKNIRKMKHS